MKKFSEVLPETVERSENGCTCFNWGVVQVEGGYEYNSVQVAGEFFVTNIKYAMMLEHYTSGEIDEMELVKKNSRKKKDKEEYAAYKSMKDGFESIIVDSIGDMKDPSEPVSEGSSVDLFESGYMHSQDEQEPMDDPMKIVYNEWGMTPTRTV